VNRREALDRYRQSPPQFEAGNRAAVKHGALAVVALRPRAAEIADALRSEIPGGPHAGDEPVLALLSLTLARLEAAHAWLEDRETLVMPGRKAEVWPILKLVGTWENSAMRLCSELGLSPRSRASLGVDRVNAPSALADHLRTHYGPDAEADDDE